MSNPRIKTTPDGRVEVTLSHPIEVDGEPTDVLRLRKGPMTVNDFFAARRCAKELAGDADDELGLTLGTAVAMADIQPWEAKAISFHDLPTLGEAVNVYVQEHATDPKSEMT